MNEIEKIAMDGICKIVGEPFMFGMKFSDTDLYIFGFGEPKENARLNCEYRIHLLCSFKIVWRNPKRESEIFYSDSSEIEFDLAFERLKGRRVRNVQFLGKVNDLVIDLGDCYILIYTVDSDEESYRYFRLNSDEPHIVVSYNWIDI